MAKDITVWGIDVGQCALKALKLRESDGKLQVEAFDIIEHPKILSEPDVNRKELIKDSLDQLLARNTLEKSVVVISVPGQSSFTRFVKLPPVEPKKIPDIVRFEAEQQIPFPIPEVIWRWQTFQNPDSPDVEVGIFAIKRGDVAEVLDNFTDVDLNVDAVQMAPLSLYNFMTFDEQLAPDGATLLADVGTDKTDLVVSDGARIWARTIQIGGNNFTEALVKAFKLPFSKAEKLKRAAATSKYARQIFQAMRPVFSDLVQEIQRSIGYYTSLHRDVRFKRLLGLGNGFRLPGLQKFLEQNLNIPVVRIDSYNNLTPSSAVNAPSFDENVLSFAVSYGLAIQGLDLSSIYTNLLPPEITRRRMWAKKNHWFAAAAAVLLVALAGPAYRSYQDRSALAAGKDLSTAERVARSISIQKKEYRKWSSQGDEERQQVASNMKLFGYRNYWPSLQALLFRSIASVATEQLLIDQYVEARDDQTRKAILERIKSIPRSDRRMIFIEKLDYSYHGDVTSVSLEAKDNRKSRTPSRQPSEDVSGQYKRGFIVHLEGRTPLEERKASLMLAKLRQRTEKLAEDLEILDVLDGKHDFLKDSKTFGRSRGRRPVIFKNLDDEDFDINGAGETQKEMLIEPDPLLPDEDMVNDTRFVVRWKITIEGDGLPAPSAE